MSDYSLSASEREKAFPIHIELGKKQSAMPMMPGEKKGKDTMAYPTVYIDPVPGLDQLPKSGCMLVEFVRKSLTLKDNADGDPAAGAEIELHTICLQGEGSDDSPGEDLMAKMNKGMPADKEDTETTADDEAAEGDE